MTNKVRPFYIRITDDMTPQMVQDAFDKCVDAGAYAGDCVAGATSNYEYESSYEFGEYKLFGVSITGSVRFYDHSRDFGEDAKEITLDQLDEWLGLESKTEWDGEGLPPVGVECEWIGGGLNHGDWGAVIVRAYNDDYAWIEKLHDKSMHTVRNPAHFRKPETPEQKTVRERLEAAKELHEVYMSVWGHAFIGWSALDDNNKEAFLAIVDKTNYRK